MNTGDRQGNTEFAGDLRGSAQEQANHQMFSHFFEKVGFAAALTNQQSGVVVDVNEAWVEIFGHSRDEAIGRTTLELGITSDPEKRAQILARVEQQGFVHNIEAQLRTKSGEWRSFLVNADLLEMGGQKYILYTAQDITEYARVKDQLEQSNQKLHEILSSIQDDFYVLDRDWRFVYANRLFTSRVGKEPEDFIGNVVWEMFPKHVGGILYQNFHAAMEKREVRRFEIPGKYTNAWYRMTVFPSAEGITVLGSDITDRKRTEEQLHELTQRLTYHVDNSPLAVIEWGPDMRLIRWSSAAEHMFGWKAEEVLGKRMEDFRWIYHEDIEQVEGVSYHLRTGTDPQRFSLNRNYRKDGSVATCEWYNSSLLDESGNLRSILSLVLDVTERKQAEEQLRYQATLLSNVNDAIVASDAQFRITAWNSAAESLYGWKAEEVIGRNGLEIVKTQWHEADAAEMRRSIAEAGHWRGEAIQARKDGSRFPVEVSSIVLYDANRQVTGYVSVNRDITERKRAEQALRDNERQLQLLNETLDQKVQEKTAEVRRLASDLTRAEQRERSRISSILHEDLQQRLFAIQMQLTFIVGQLQPEDEQAIKDLVEVKAQVDDTLMVTRRLSIDLSPPILHDEGLFHAIRWLASQMKERYGLQTDVYAEGPFGFRDKDLQVLLFNCVRELLFNIVKHAGVKQAVVMLRMTGTDLTIEVRDRGRGLDPAIVEKSVHAAGVEEDAPHSFGLATIRHQLSILGGCLDVQSEPGAGTRIILKVPVTEEG